jgi:hypothetical protein
MMAIKKKRLSALLIKQKAKSSNDEVKSKYPKKESVFVYELARHVMCKNSK